MRKPKANEPVASIGSSAQCGAMAKADNTFLLHSSRGLWLCKKNALPRLGGVLMVCVGLMIGCAPVGRNTPNHATLPETRMTNVQGPWCGTCQMMEDEALKAKTDVLLVQVKLALFASETLLAPDSPDAARESATIILKNVMNDLRELEASFDPKTGGAAVSPKKIK